MGKKSTVVGHVMDALLELLRKADAAQQKAVRVWIAIAKVLHGQGWLADNITGENRDVQKVADLRVTIIAAFPSKAQDLLRLDPRDVGNLSDGDKAVRLMYQQRIGAYVSLVARHMRGMEPTKLRAPKKKDDAGSVKGDTFEGDKSPMHGWARRLQALSAAALMVRNDKNENLSAEDAVALQDAIKMALAIMGKYTA